MAPPLEGDLRAGFTGLLVSLVILLALVYGIVQLTNRKFADHGSPAAASTH